MKTLGMILGSVFLYSLCANIAYRLFVRFDPPSKYSNDSLGTWYDRQTNKSYEKMNLREKHETYIAFGTFFWPVSLAIWLLYWTLFRLPYRIVMRAERFVDKSGDEQDSNKHYRG